MITFSIQLQELDALTGRDDYGVILENQPIGIWDEDEEKAFDLLERDCHEMLGFRDAPGITTSFEEDSK